MYFLYTNFSNFKTHQSCWMVIASNLYYKIKIRKFKFRFPEFRWDLKITNNQSNHMRWAACRHSAKIRDAESPTVADRGMTVGDPSAHCKARPSRPQALTDWGLRRSKEARCATIRHLGRGRLGKTNKCYYTIQKNPVSFPSCLNNATPPLLQDDNHFLNGCFSWLALHLYSI